MTFRFSSGSLTARNASRTCSTVGMHLLLWRMSQPSWGGTLRPDARDAGPARGTQARGRHALPENLVAEPLDQQLVAVRAPGVLPATHAPRQVAGVHVPEPCVPADLANALQVLRRRVP